MDIDDLKTAWLQHGRQLSGSLKLNEALLREIKLNASRKELQKPLHYEIANTVVLLILLPVFALISLKYGQDLKLLMTGILICLVFLITLILSIRKIKHFYSIDYYHAPVIRLQEQVARLNNTILKTRKTELMLLPLMIVPAIILLMKLIHDIDVFADPRMLLAYATAGIGFTLIATVFINKYLYDKKIKAVENLLRELENYQKEN